jgi:MFS family permease
MFKDRNISIGLISALFIYLGLCVIIYQLPFYLQEILGFGQIKTGAIIVGTPISMAIVSIIVGAFSKKISAKYISTIGFLGISLAFILMAVFLTDLSSVGFLVIITVIIGVSLAAFFGPNSTSILSSAPKEKVGTVSGILNLISLVGYSLGTALSTTVFVAFRNWFQNSNGIPIFLDPNAIPPVYNPANYNPSLRLLLGIFAVLMILGAVISFNRIKLDQEKRRRHLVHIHFFQH